MKGRNRYFTKCFWDKRGLTLAELIIAAALLMVVLTVTLSLLIHGNRSFRMSMNQTDAQSDVRVAADFISNELRNASEIRLDNITDTTLLRKYNSLRIDGHNLKFKEAGLEYTAASERLKSGAVFATAADLSFTVTSVSGRYMLSFTLTGSSGSQTYPLTSKVLLNNISSASSITGTTGNSIFYLEPESAAASQPEQATLASAASVAAAITSVNALARDASVLSLPAVPSGYAVSIKSSSNPSVISVNGVITPPVVTTVVSLVFSVTRTYDNTSADTASISITVLSKSLDLSSVGINIAAGRLTGTSSLMQFCVNGKDWVTAANGSTENICFQQGIVQVRQTDYPMNIRTVASVAAPEAAPNVRLEAISLDADAKFQSYNGSWFEDVRDASNLQYTTTNPSEGSVSWTSISSGLTVKASSGKKYFVRKGATADKLASAPTGDLNIYSSWTWLDWLFWYLFD